MKKKEILRKIVLVFCMLEVLHGFILILEGKIELFCVTGISVLAAVTVWGTVLVLRIVDQIKFLKQYKIGKEYFDYLQWVHKKRYQSYFSYNKEKIDEYSAEIEKYGNVLLKAGGIWLAKMAMTKRRRKK